MVDTSKSKILVVDDDVQLLRDIQDHLEQRGYTVATASDGLSALAMAKSMAPDLVVLDITFPDIKTARERAIDGIEVLRRLRDAGNVLCSDVRTYIYAAGELNPDTVVDTWLKLARHKYKLS